MTEFTDEQLAVIEAAAHTVIPSAAIGQLMNALRPAPKFAEGQVLARKPPNGDTLYFRHGPTNAYYDSYSHRALTLTEMGPLVVNLVDAIADAHAADTPTSIYLAWQELEKIHGRSK